MNIFVHPRSSPRSETMMRKKLVNRIELFFSLLTSFSGSFSLCQLVTVVDYSSISVVVRHCRSLCYRFLSLFFFPRGYFRSVTSSMCGSEPDSFTAKHMTCLDAIIKKKQLIIMPVKKQGEMFFSLLCGINLLKQEEKTLGISIIFSFNDQITLNDDIVVDFQASASRSFTYDDVSIDLSSFS